MSESTENNNTVENTTAEETQEFSLKSFSYKLKKRPVSKGSVGSLWLSTQFCFQNVDPKSPFGQKFMQLEGKLKPLLDAVNKLFVEHYCEAGYMGDIICTVFLDDFRGKSFVRGSNRDHIQANLVTVIECLLHRLRYWHRRMERSGWNGRFSADQLAFQEQLENILKLVPEQVEETFLVRRREEEQKDESKESTVGEAESTENATTNEVMEEEEEDGDKFDKTKFRKVHKFVEPLVKEIEDVVREAVLAQRQASADNNTKQNDSRVPRKQSKYVRGQKRREMKRAGSKDNNKEGDNEWKEQGSKGGYEHVKKWMNKKEKSTKATDLRSEESEDKNAEQVNDSSNKFDALAAETMEYEGATKEMAAVSRETE